MTLKRLVGPIAATLLAGCSAPGEDSAPSIDPASDTAALDVEPESAPTPDHFYGTAWRAIADDGARYVTYLDAGGTYRDLRNGDLWQEGAWSHDEGPEGQVLCFTPDEENGVERCWTPGRITDGSMIATNAAGRRIELEQVPYDLPEDGGNDPVDTSNIET